MQRASAPIPPTPSAPTNLGMVRQVLSTPWLSVVVITSGLFLLGMMALTIWGGRGLLAMWRMQHDLERMTRDIEIIEQENSRLGREVQRLQTDLGYIEKIAREELGMIRPGEIVLEFPD